MDQAQTKILRKTEGLETQAIEERASETARAEGRAKANDLDWTRARAELSGATMTNDK